jgi:hypothetical protein
VPRIIVLGCGSTIFGQNDRCSLCRAEPCHTARMSSRSGDEATESLAQTMMKQRVRSLEKKFDEAGGGACRACYSTDGRLGWVPLFRPTEDEGSTYGADERVTRCGAQPRDVIELTTDAMAT